MGGSTLDFPGTMKPWGVGHLATHTVKGEKTAGHLANGTLLLKNAGQLAQNCRGAAPPPMGKL